MGNHERDDEGPNGAREMGRRETLQLATLAAALGAGLSVSLHVDEASAADAPEKMSAGRFQFKFYQVQHKDSPTLVHTVTLPEEIGKKLLDSAALVQWKLYSKEDVLGAGQAQFKGPQKQQQQAPVVKLPVDATQPRKP